MARPRSFDETAVLDEAVRVFQRKGYEATSMQEIAAAVRLGSGSIYGAFGDKHGLFLRALARYSEAQTVALREAFATDGPVLPALQRSLEESLTMLEPCRGADPCLLVNTSGELVPRDEEATAQVAAAFDEFESVIQEALIRAHERGELGPGVEPCAAAGLLLVVMQGLQAVGRAAPDAPRLRAAIDVAFAGISGRASGAASP